MAGEATARYIAQWDGSTWSGLDTGMNDWVYALAANGTELYAGGYFTTAGGVSANNIARWDGNGWSALGSGTDDHVRVLAVDGAGHMFVGGAFNVAGTNVSPCIAQANNIPPSAAIRYIRVDSGSVVLDCQGVAGVRYAVHRATDVLFTANLTTVLTTNVPANGLFRCTDTSPPNAAAFYRLLKQ